MKTKMKLGFGHMDMSNSVYIEYEKGNHEIVPYDSEKPRTGSHYCIVDSLGGDRIPIDPDFDYSKIDVDLIYWWLQGGATKNSVALKSIKKLRKQWDGILLINWEEAYWFTKPYVKQRLESCIESAELATAVVNGYLNFDRRMDDIQFKSKKVKWRYLVTPYDTEWIKNKYAKTPKSETRIIYSMIHGRTTKCERTLTTMYDLHKEMPNLEYVINRYRFVPREDFNEITLKSTDIPLEDLKFIKVIDPLDPWEVYANYIGSSWMFIDEYPSYSQSHATLDSACFGTPVLSHQYNSAAVICFPKIIVEFNNVNQWFKMAKKLLVDQEFYNSVRDYGTVAVSHYSIESFYKQLCDIYDEFKK